MEKAARKATEAVARAAAKARAREERASKKQRTSLKAPSVEEEDAVCLLQALLGDALPGVGRDRVLADMDAWGYTFRLGSARAYFDDDADAAWTWLVERGLATEARRLARP